jgi:hypothetical protein
MGTCGGSVTHEDSDSSSPLSSLCSRVRYFLDVSCGGLDVRCYYGASPGYQSVPLSCQALDNNEQPAGPELTPEHFAGRYGVRADSFMRALYDAQSEVGA